MKTIWGIIGIYALFCFWAPVFWLTDHLMDVHNFDQFRFEFLTFSEKLLYVFANIMSLVTAAAVLMNWKDPDFINNE